MRRSLLLAAPLFATVAAAQVRPGVKPGWEWSDDSVFAVVNAVRAGKSLKPKAWPNGARVAVLFSFDVDNETVSIRFGERPSALCRRTNTVPASACRVSSRCSTNTRSLSRTSSRR
jgi:hypothetical protein